MITRLHKSIGTKFLVMVGVFVSILCCFLLYRTWSQSNSQTKRMAAAQAELGLQFDLAIRDYVAEHIRPFAERHVDDDDFIPEVMSTSFVARKVFEQVRRQFPDCIVKFSSKDPRNPRNKAGPEELEIIEYFKEHPESKQWSGKIELDGKHYQAHFRPRRAEAACLHCHGDPRDAPSSLVKRYGDQGAFHWTAGDVIALDMVAMPTDKYEEAALIQMAKNSLVLMVGLAFLLVAIYCGFRFLVARRLIAISRHFTTALGQTDCSFIARIDDDGSDEISALAKSFNLLADKLHGAYAYLEHRVTERTGELEAANSTLNKEVSQRTRAEAALQESRNFLQTIIDGMPEPIMVLGLDYRILLANRAAREAADKNEAELCLLNCHQANHGRDVPCDGPEHPCPLGQVVATKAPCSVIHTHRDAEDNQARTEVNAAPIFDETGEVAQVIECCRDVTERERLQQELRDYAHVLESANIGMEQFSQAAESANRAKSEFLANMSHEIRTPMTAILGFADLLLESLSEPPEIEAAKTIKRNGDYLVGLINDILDLSKIEARKLEVQPTACSPAKLLGEVASLMQVRTRTKNLSLTVEYDGPIPESIQTDATRLRQILINLVGNAVKFTEVGGIRLVLRLLVETGQSAKLRFDVIDTGIGVTSEEAARIFEPFTQADASTSRRFGGTGLGLTVSKALAKMLGGDISCTSTPGIGSTFSLTITTGPLDGVRLLDSPAEAVAEHEQESNVAGSPKIDLDCRVLLAEDGPDNQRLIEFILKKAGATVTLAENGRIALDKALAAGPSGGKRYDDPGEPFDVVLMDIQMPVMDGYEATRRLRAGGYTGPVIALTAHAMSDDRERCLAAGCNDFMTKPIDRDRLLEIVSRYANDRPHLVGATEGPETGNNEPSEAHQ